MVNRLPVSIEHSIEMLATAAYEIDLDSLRDWVERTGRVLPAEGEPWPGDLLREYIEDELDSGEPVSWIPNFDMPDGYEYLHTNVQTVTATQPVKDPA